MRPIASRTCIVALLALAVLAPAGAQAPATVALSDFVVNSANPSFAYLGKGFAEIIAFEVKKAPQVRLVDREQRNRLLEEMEFSLTGLTDPSAQLQIGKLLSVQFLVSGSITDMGGPLLVSLSMVDVQTGQVVWNDQLTESGGKYAYIGAYFGKSLLKHFKATVSKSTEQALASAKEGDSASVVALSKGIAALDEGKKDEAKKQLTEAKKIDPGNAVAEAYLSKLASASAKFKVVPERYVSYYNPAYLGGMDKDRAYFDVYSSMFVAGVRDTNNGGWFAPNPSGEYGATEMGGGASVGYAMPLARSVGIGFDLVFMGGMRGIVDVYGSGNFPQLDSDAPLYVGGICTAGYSLSPNLSLGAGLAASFKRQSLFKQSIDETEYTSTIPFGGILAALVKNGSGRLAWDIMAAYGMENLYWYDPVADEFLEYNKPVYVEQTLTATLGDNRSFIALKQVNDFYPDQDLYYGRMMPCVEHWLGDRLAVRAGVEGVLVWRDEVGRFGLGGTAGLTFKTSDRFELDVNVTLRKRPSWVLDQTIATEGVIFVTGTWNGNSGR